MLEIAEDLIRANIDALKRAFSELHWVRVWPRLIERSSVIPLNPKQSYFKGHYND